MKISILLPYKENFSPIYPGAVSLFVNDTSNLSKYKKNIVVYGNTNYKKKFWRANRKESPGGAIAGLGIHMIDLMCQFGGKVRSIQSLVKKYA